MQYQHSYFPGCQISNTTLEITFKMETVVKKYWSFLTPCTICLGPEVNSVSARANNPGNYKAVGKHLSLWYLVSFFLLPEISVKRYTWNNKRGQYKLLRCCCCLAILWRWCWCVSVEKHCCLLTESARKKLLLSRNLRESVVRTTHPLYEPQWR